ncbi:hypothetical protein ACLOJK_034846, partial [Asimina triloba]
MANTESMSYEEGPKAHTLETSLPISMHMPPAQLISKRAGKVAVRSRSCLICDKDIN